SIDHPEETRHDAARGLKNFRKAIEGLRLLHAAGFEVGITRQSTPGEDAQKVAARFRQLLRRHGLPEDLPVVALPDLAALGQTEALAAAVPEIGRSEERALPACAQGRMLLCR